MDRETFKIGVFNALTDTSSLEALRGLRRGDLKKSIIIAMKEFVGFTEAFCERNGYSRTNVLLAFAEFHNNVLNNSEKEKYNVRLFNLIYKADYLVIIDILLEDERRK